MAIAFDPTKITRFIERGVKALESIAANMSKPPIETKQVFTPGASEVIETPHKTIPAFFTPRNGSVVFDETPANGHAFIDDEGGIVIKLPREYFPDFVREVFGRDDVELMAVSVGLNYKSKPLT